MEIASGLGIGLLVGTLIGMSTSEVVGTVVAALTALLAAYFGLSGSTADAALDRRRLQRITAFGVAALAGVIVSLYMRTHRVLARDAAESIAEWQNAGYDSTTARNLVVFERTGLISPGWAGVLPRLRGRLS